MRIALVGKGGVGKSMVAGTLARVLARRGRSVLVGDLDTNPGLSYSIGIGPQEAGLPLEALEEHEGSAYGWRLGSELTPRDVVERYTMAAPDGVRYIGIHKAHEDDLRAPRRSIAAVISVLRGFRETDWDVIGDLEAGTTTPFERYHNFADQVLIVVNPASSSALAARRIRSLVDDRPIKVLANRWNGTPDHGGEHPMARIPFDSAVAEVERAGLAPLDHCPDSPAIRAIEELADMLLAEPAPATRLAV